ncbi:hypothetical protein QWJ07_10895 [Frankia sp. RB7]|nr:hypothetical protein [Frankia sp. RB7]
MAKKAKAKPQPVIYPDSVRPPPVLPDARSVADMGFSLTEDELMTVRTAMAIHASSRQPKLLWTGWRQIALALYIGSQHAKKASGGNTATPLYIRANSEFLKKSGLAFINHNDRAAAVRLLPYWDEIDDWRSSLTPQQRQRLNNPREVWDTYIKHRRELGDPVASRPPMRRQKKSREGVTLLDQYVALEAQVELLTEQRDRAEREIEYFAAMAATIAKQAKLSDDEMAKIRTKVRAEAQGETEKKPTTE